MDWTFVSWHVLWSHALILVVTLALARFLQIFNSRQERRQAAQRWEPPLRLGESDEMPGCKQSLHLRPHRVDVIVDGAIVRRVRGAVDRCARR